jgi:Uma2 family endonuclease
MDGRRYTDGGESMATTRGFTDADLMGLPRDGRKYELVDGEIRVTPAGMRHEDIAAELLMRLRLFAKQQGLGKVLGSSTGYRLPNGNIRSPDVSFVTQERLPDGKAPVGFGELAPDLAVEILSPEDSKRQVLEKVGEYLEAGVRLVWVIDPEQRRAAVHRSLTEVRELAEDGQLEGEDVIPGFSGRLSEILA